MNIFSQIGIIMLIGLVAKERYLDRRVRPGFPEGRQSDTGFRLGSRTRSFTSDPDDLVRLCIGCHAFAFRYRSGSGQPYILRCGGSIRYGYQYNIRHDVHP